MSLHDAFVAIGAILAITSVVVVVWRNAKDFLSPADSWGARGAYGSRWRLS